MANSNEDFIKHSFLCGLRGFHVYKEIWKSIVGELLRCSHERNNIYDRYAIVANKRLRGRLADSIIGHLPREISRATRFFLLRGGMVHLKVTDENYRRSPLIQGGLEIPVEVICEMDDTPRNRAIMERYKTLVTTQYKEPGQDGKFDDCTKDVLEELCEDDYSDAEEELEPNVDTD